ncbi:MAG: hypothetical protein JXP73_20525 [Deltaproteobacteria bacterium]|nr:hypothetical protein [Deltaproteobacteria bacterium]
MRALATGDAGPQLNPSGISMMRGYQLESAYQYGSTMGAHDARVSAVASLSSPNLGGALGYTFHHASPELVRETGHLLGGSLSLPFVDRFFFGATAKYVRSSGYTTLSGLTWDAGLTVRPIPQFSMGLVAYNLRDLGIEWLPRGVGAGVAVLPMPTLLLFFDAVSEMATFNAHSRASVTQPRVHYMGGGEICLSSVAAIRVGGGWNGRTRNGYLSAGVSALSAYIGALEAGLRQEVSGESRTTTIGMSARLFIPGT